MEYIILSKGNNLWDVNSINLELNGKFNTIEDVSNLINSIYSALINFDDLRLVGNKISFLTATQIYTFIFSVEFEKYIIEYLNNLDTRINELSLNNIFKLIFNRDLKKTKRSKGFTNIILKSINDKIVKLKRAKRVNIVTPVYSIELYKNDKNIAQWNINGTVFCFRGNKYTSIDIIKIMIEDIYNTLIIKKPLISLCEEYCISAVISIATLLFQETFTDYVAFFGESLIDREILINSSNLTEAIFNTNGEGCVYTKEYWSIINGICKKLYVNQYENSNNKIDFNAEIWKVIFKEANNLSTVNINFNFIKHKLLKREIKSYMKTLINNKVILESRYKSFKKSIPYIEEMSGIKCIADINPIEAINLFRFLEKLEDVSVSYLLQINASLKSLTEWLIENSNNIKTPKPSINSFKSIKIDNLENMVNSTEYIPDDICDKMLEHIDDINPIFQRLLILMLNVGLHYKDATYLYEDCYEYDKENNIHILNFIQWKNLNRRRKAGLSDFIQVPIREEVAIEIKNQFEETKNLRVESGLRQIFIHGNRNRIIVIGSKGFINAVNKMIIKNDIKKSDGEYWHFTTKQCRKTLAVEMVMNGASIREVAYMLAHASEKTTEKCYAEVRKYKLADMNSNFWLKEFQVIVPEKQLMEFSIEERKMLFVDFKLHVREVELGWCMKQVWEGDCDKRTGKTNCATCNKICTGFQQLEKWIKLRDSQQIVIGNLIDMYQKLKIADYENYRNYQKDLNLLNAYNDTISKITCKIPIEGVLNC